MSQFMLFEDAPLHLNPKGKTARKQAKAMASSQITDIVEGRKLRDEGVARVRSNNPEFHARAVATIKAIPVGTEGIAEWYRLQVSPVIGNPKHPNAWGSVIKALINTGFLIGTGEYAPMTSPGSHARSSQILRRA